MGHVVFIINQFLIAYSIQNQSEGSFEPLTTYCINSGKLLREKTFTNFEVLQLFVKIFSAKFGGVVSFGDTSEQSAKVFSVKIY